jgi:hypothetical protein
MVRLMNMFTGLEYDICAGSTLAWFDVFINIELLFTTTRHFLKGTIHLTYFQI